MDLQSSLIPKASIRILIVTAVAFLMAGCGFPGSIWIQSRDGHGKPVDGALNIGNTRPPILERCGTTGFFASGPTCARAFVDSSGAKIDMHELRDSLDAIGEIIEPLKPLVLRVSTGKYKALPYRLYLLTISPAVVLAVPQPDNLSAPICSYIFGGCIQSTSFAGNAYWYVERPRIEKGSFWFSPELPGKTFPIDSTAPDVQLEIGQSKLTLRATGSQWEVNREK